MSVQLKEIRQRGLQGLGASDKNAENGKGKKAGPVALGIGFLAFLGLGFSVSKWTSK